MSETLWLSHSRIREFLECPRAYYIDYVYRDPATKHKVQLMTAPLALGQAVHKVLESLSVLPVKERFSRSLLQRLEEQWPSVSGKKGGFLSAEQEEAAYRRAEAMLRRVQDNPGPLANLAVKIQTELPSFTLSAPDQLVLCGKIDWLEYLPELEQVRIIDFKTSRNEEPPDSLQLPIYALLASKTQNRTVVGASYWYLENDDAPAAQSLPDLDETASELIRIGKQIQTAHALNRFRCPQGETGCRACRPLEKIVQGTAEFVGPGEYGKDIYILSNSTPMSEGVVL